MTPFWAFVSGMICGIAVAGVALFVWALAQAAGDADAKLDELRRNG